jgi:hypothetical protein
MIGFYAFVLEGYDQFGAFLFREPAVICFFRASSPCRVTPDTVCSPSSHTGVVSLHYNPCHSHGSRIQFGFSIGAM